MMEDWEWYNIIPARISLVCSGLIVIHILYLFYFSSMNLKPFHITSLLMSCLDLIQNLGYAIPLSCPYAVSMLLFGCLSKATIMPGFMYYLYLLLYHQGIDKNLLFWKFISFCLISFLIPITSVIFLSTYSDYLNSLCDQNNFADNIHSPIGQSLNDLIFLLAIIIPCLIGYVVFVYFILLVIWKIGYAVLSQVGRLFVYRFTLGLLIYTFGAIPGVYFLILYTFNIQSDRIFTLGIKMSGVCLCSLGFLYAIFYFLNIPTVVSCLIRATPSSKPPTNERTTLGELVHLPALSEPIILSENYRFSSASSPLLLSLTSNSSPSFSSTSPAPAKTIRQSELSFVELLFNRKNADR